MRLEDPNRMSEIATGRQRAAHVPGLADF